MSHHHRKFHTRKSPRHPTFDYTNAGAYFITFNTLFHQHFFGEIKNGKMILNNLGNIVKKYRTEIPNHFDHVNIDEFIVMPNHIHGILLLNNNKNISSHTRTDDALRRPSRQDKAMPLSLHNNRNKKTIPKKWISPKPGSVSTIIGSYKSICTKTIRQKHNKKFSRQPRYHDRIIRDQEAYNHIRRYIINNPKNWKKK